MERINLRIAGVGLVVISFFILIFSTGWGLTFLSWGLTFLVIGIVFIIGSFYYFYKWQTINSILFRVERQPLTRISMISSDVPVAIEGKIEEDDTTLISPFKKTKCVFYHYIEEKYVRSGDSSHWKIIENKSEHVPFHVVDSTGKISVSLQNVDSDLGDYKLVKNKIINMQFLDYSNSEVDAKKLVFHENIGEDKGIRISEYVLEPAQDVFVYGWVYSNKSGKFISESKESPLIVSRKNKENYLEDFAIGNNFFYSNNLLLFIGVMVLYYSLNYLFNISILYLYFMILIIFLRMIAQSYNRMIILRSRLRNSSSQIDIELKKRTELVPELTKLVDAYKKYESNIFKQLVKLREEFSLDAQGMKKYSVQEKSLAEGLIALAENYPKIKADINFKDLMFRLSQIEYNIAYYRGFYSKTVLKYNTLICTIPFSVLAKIAGFKKEEYWSDNKKG